jgi:uncharacterized protein
MTSPRALLFAVCIASCFSAGFAKAQSRLGEINQKTITILSGEPQWFKETLTISKNVNHNNGVRVLPMYGDGCIESAANLLQLTTVDIAILSSDCVEYAERQGLIQSAKKLNYVARIKALPILMLTRRDIPNITALAGRRIATGSAHSASFAAGELLLGGLELPFIRVASSGIAAVQLLQAGGADAVLLHGVDALDGTLDPKKFHVLSLSAPGSMAKTFAPALLEGASLQGLAGDQKSVETVSTSLLLAVYNWPSNSAKAEKLKQFSNAYFEEQALTESASELSTAVPGWTRHETSQHALETLNTSTPELQQGDGP